AVAAELGEEVGAGGGEEVVVLEGGVVRELVEQLEAFGGAEGHGDGDGAVQLDDGGAGELGQRIVEGDDAAPVRLVRGAGARVAGRNGSLQRVRAERTRERDSLVERSEATADEQLVPAGAVLLEQEDGVAVGVDAGAGA